MRWGGSVVVVLVSVVLLWAGSPQAATRLGLHVTAEELAIWQSRATSGPYKTAGDVSTNSPGDWTRIVANAATFHSNPSAQHMKGIGPHLPLSAPVVPCDNGAFSCGTQTPCPCGEIFSSTGTTVNDVANLGYLMRDAAFYALVAGPNGANALTYRNDVLTALLALAGEAGMDPTNSTHWDFDTANDGSPFFAMGMFLTRWLFAYDYIRIAGALHGGSWTISSANQLTLDTWFINWGTWFHDLQRTSDKNYGPQGPYVNPDTNFADHTNYTLTSTGNSLVNTLGNLIWATSGGNGPQVTELARRYNNRLGEMEGFTCQVAVAMSGNANSTIATQAALLVTRSKQFTKDWLKYGVFTSNDIGDMERNVSDGVSVGLAYSGALGSGMIECADAIARTGDTSLYDYVTLSGDGAGTNIQGAGKSIYNVIINFLHYADHSHNPLRYSTAQGGGINDNHLIDLEDELNSNFRVLDVWMGPQANIYFQDSYIASVYQRQANDPHLGTTMTAYPSNPSSCCGISGGAWMGGSSRSPAVLFMFGQMEGQVNPYDLSPGAVPLVSGGVVR